MGKKVKPNSIKTIGQDIPKPVASFKQLNERYPLPEHLWKAIQASNFKSPTAVQSQTLPVMLERREVICSAPTGSGKTLAFILPIILQLKEPKRLGSFRAVILSPTRELAKQIHREALWISKGSNLRIHHLKDIKEAAVKFSPDSIYKFDILITTPNRLAALLRAEPPALSLDKLEWLILDESDRLFELGFKDDLEVIYRHSIRSQGCCRAFFSATLDSKLVDWAKLQMNDVIIVVIGGKNRPAPGIRQELVHVGNEDGKRLALRDLIMSGIKVPVLIFVESKEKAKSIADDFQYDNLNMDFMHSERDPKDRDSTVASFRAGEIWFLVCTDLMGRGIDFKGVNVVINYDCPQTKVSYIHRIGRTGRANRQGRAITFVTDRDRNAVSQIAKVIKLSGSTIPNSISALLASKSKAEEKKRKGQLKGKDDKRKKFVKGRR